MVSGTGVPLTRLTVVVESCRENTRWTLVPVAGMLQPGSVPAGESILQGPALALVAACAIWILNFDEKPVTSVGLVVVLALSSEVNSVTLICGPPTTLMAWRQTRFVGGALAAVIFQSPWN